MAPGQDTYAITWLNVRINRWWQDGPGELPASTLVADWLTQMWRANGQDYGAFAGATVNLISQHRPDRDQLARDGKLWRDGAAGLTWGDGLVEVRGDFAGARTLGHEAGGHGRAYRHEVWRGAGWAAELVLDQFDRLRWPDYTANTPAVERWAEDCAWAFGPDGVRGTLDPNDDGRRKPWDVPGLWAFLLYFPGPLAYWRRFGGISQCSYDGPAETWYWVRSTWWSARWERCKGGKFDYWSGSSWTPFNP